MNKRRLFQRRIITGDRPESTFLSRQYDLGSRGKGALCLGHWEVYVRSALVVFGRVRFSRQKEVAEFSHKVAYQSGASIGGMVFQSRQRSRLDR